MRGAIEENYKDKIGKNNINNKLRNNDFFSLFKFLFGIESRTNAIYLAAIE